MMHLGNFLREIIKERGLKNYEVAERAGLTPQDLSGTLGKQDMYCSKWEKLCSAIGIDPAVAFNENRVGDKNFSDINVSTLIGPATLNINQERKAYQDLIQEKERIIQEKERLIQILMKNQGLENG